MEQTSANIGALNEYQALIWLANQGYEVYRNVVPNGDTDFLVYKDGTYTRIDVKTLRKSDKNSDWNFSWLTYVDQAAIDKGIRILFVKDGTVGWNRDYFPAYKNN
jgi:Holliday junction resolvase-like predicted endonuclease